MSSLRAFRNDPFASSLVVMALLGATGIGATVQAYRSLARLAFVAAQVPYVVSGGLGGLALVGFAIALLAIQKRRWTEAKRREEFDGVVRAAAQLLAAVRDESERRR